METLPQIMVAPNGARRTKVDHPAIPVTIEETVETAKLCFGAGAGALHAHVRNEQQEHVLDAGFYRELVHEMKLQVPEMGVQITTEAVGRYTPTEQRKLVRAVMPDAVSVGLREILSDGDVKAARAFYHGAKEASVHVQHIFYDSGDVVEFFAQQKKGVIPSGDSTQMIFVLGRYTEGQQSDPDSLGSFLNALGEGVASADWAVCAFGSNETACLSAALDAGGKTRVGFENSIWNADGSVAKDNVERVRAIRALTTLH